MPKAESNGEPASKEELARLSEEYLRTRNSQMASKAAIAEMELARRRGELISKKAAFASLSYLLVCFRQRTLLAHRTIAGRLARLGLIDDANEHRASEVIGEEIRGLLTELANLPTKVTNPDWLRELERENAGTAVEERQPTPDEHRHTEARAASRRQKKTETMRGLREAGRA